MRVRGTTNKYVIFSGSRYSFETRIPKRIRNYFPLNCCQILSINLKAVFDAQIYQDVKNRNQRQMTMTQRHNSSHNHGSGSGSGSDSTQSSVRRKQEDNLAVVFMGIVLVFGVCHAPRLFLSLYEMIDIRRAMDCSVSWGSDRSRGKETNLTG